MSSDSRIILHSVGLVEFVTIGFLSILDFDVQSCGDVWKHVMNPDSLCGAEVFRMSYTFDFSLHSCSLNTVLHFAHAPRIPLSLYPMLARVCIFAQAKVQLKEYLLSII